jgi:hypothetical protein
MKEADYRLIGNVAMALGFGLIVLGVLILVTTGIGTSTNASGNVTGYYLQNTTNWMSLVVIGFTICGIGFAFRSRANAE